MYPLNEISNNRLPRTPARPEKTFVQSMGTMAAQAACVVVIAKLVDVAVEAFMNRKRQQQPQRRREEVVA
jgi:hypothetical protein